jgi:hypothetical protein
MLVQGLSSFKGQQDYKYHTEQLAIDHQILCIIKMLKLDGGKASHWRGSGFEYI